MTIPEQLRFKAKSCGLIVHKVYDGNNSPWYQIIRDGEILVKLRYDQTKYWLAGYKCRYTEVDR